MPALLTIDKLRAGYGPIDALQDVTIHVDEGEIVAMIGANGAGKTTTLMSVSGIVKARAGSVVFANKDITLGSQVVASRFYAPLFHMPSIVDVKRLEVTGQALSSRQWAEFAVSRINIQSTLEKR